MYGYIYNHTFLIIFLFFMALLDTLPNRYFEDFPIEFKKLNPEDFTGFDCHKTEIDLDQNGYIADALSPHIDLDIKNTIVINTQVGSGKSTGIINAVKSFYDDDNNYMIFVASPFKSLVNQYYDKLKDVGIDEEHLFNYEDLEEAQKEDYLDKKVHIITVNTLLSNPGDYLLTNSGKKKEYILNLVEFCEDNRIKVVFIYDEIHDAIHNFKELYLFNLWRWKDVIHKNIVLSATFNEASKVVIKNFATLTDNRIKILESERKIIPDKISNLFLFYDNANQYTYKNETVFEVVERIINDNKDIDILCYSRKLAKDLVNGENSKVGKLLKEKYPRKVKLCVSGLIEDEEDLDKNRYDEEYCNVGTNFKTGISIEKENHAFLIIMPPSGVLATFANNQGIFSNGINSVIQALARKRKVGDIYVILPYPKQLQFNTLPFRSVSNVAKDNFIKFYRACARGSNNQLSEYYNLNEQYGELEKFYKENYEDYYDKAKAKYNESQNALNLKLNFPDIDRFILDSGEKCLVQYFEFFGKDLSTFITYSAFTNQFVNCKLAGINLRAPIIIEENDIKNSLKEFVLNYIFKNESLNYLIDKINLKYYYHEFRHELFNYHVVLYKEKETDKLPKVIKAGDVAFIEREIIGVIQRIRFKNEEYNRAYDENNFQNEFVYTRGFYFRSCISHAIQMKDNIGNYDENTQRLINSYILLDKFRELVISTKEQIILRGNRRLYVLPNNINEKITELFNVDEFNVCIEGIVNFDFVINNGFFPFKDGLENTNSLEQRFNSFYKYILQDFFETIPRKVRGINCKEIISNLEIPVFSSVINFLEGADYNDGILDLEKISTEIDINSIEIID